MNLDVKYQKRYSRGELLLRSIFGPIYILIPHLFILIFVSLWAQILSFISWWIVLFTAEYPKSFFEFQEGLYRWNLRVNARLNNLCDGYPPFGINAEDEYTVLEIPYPERLSRGTLLLRTFFGAIYVILPHAFMLFFRTIASTVLQFIAWWVVLFTAEYPKSWHEFNVGTLRWAMRVNVYMSFMTDEYPPFSGKP